MRIPPSGRNTGRSCASCTSRQSPIESATSSSGSCGGATPGDRGPERVGRIARQAKRSQRIEQIEIEPGQYVAKRVLDCSRRELLLLAAQYERKGRGMLRRAAFYRTLEAQLKLAGIDEAESLGDWMAQQEHDGS